LGCVNHNCGIPRNQSQPVDAPPAVELQEAQTQTENQTAQAMAFEIHLP